MNVAIERREVLRFRTLVAERLGLCFDDAKLDFLSEVLRTQFEGKQENVASYLEQLPTQAPDWGALAERLTVGETYFFRYHDHFRAFGGTVLKECAKYAATERRLRVLSAGSASGEEAYSLAMAIREERELNEYDVRIVGIDVNPEVIARAERGRYSAWALRDTPAEIRRRYFSHVGRNFDLDPAIRAMVTFHRRNLVDEDPMFWYPDAFDVVFCRNVLMYFTPDATRSVVGKISLALRPDGFLFLGHAETLRGVSDEYDLRHTHNTFYYRRRGGPQGADDAVRTRESRSAIPRAYETWPNMSVALGLNDSSWFDTIRQASERVARLTDRRPTDPEVIAPPASSPSVGVDWSSFVDMMREERFAEAMTILQGLPAAVQKAPESRLLRAILLTNAGQHVEAQDACEPLLTAANVGAKAHYLLALCREHAGDRASALVHSQTAASLEPRFAMPHLHLGLLERRAGRLDQARARLGQALALLADEEASHIVLFGGGFGRDALMNLCRSELRKCGEPQ